MSLIVVTTVLCLAVGLILVIGGSIPFSSAPPFSFGEPYDPSAGQKVVGALCILAGVVVGLVVPAATGWFALRWARR